MIPSTGEVSTDDADEPARHCHEPWLHQHDQVGRGCDACAQICSRSRSHEAFAVCLHRLDMMPQAACWWTVTSEMADSRPTEHAPESHGTVLHFLGLGAC